MIRIIKAHNRLNGIKFSTVEFAFTALFIIPFAIYYVLHKQFVPAFISTGIIINCLPVVYYGMDALRKKEDDARTIWNSRARGKLMAENPHMLRDTLVLASLTLLPLVVLVLVLAEVFQSGRAGTG